MPCMKCALNFKKRHFEEKIDYFQIIVSAVWFFLVITNKSARIYLNIYGDTVIQNLKSEKTRKSGLVPMSKQ